MRDIVLVRSSQIIAFVEYPANKDSFPGLGTRHRRPATARFDNTFHCGTNDFVTHALRESPSPISVK